MFENSDQDEDVSVERVTSRLRSSNSSSRSFLSVCFPAEEKQLITGYFDPPNPWQYAECITLKDVIDAYKASCEKHGVQPLTRVLKQLEGSDLDVSRNECLDLKGEQLAWGHCESLEEVLKRVQFKSINLEATSLDDEGSVALFDMVEYYEAAVHLNISSNPNIGVRGWQACSRMIKKTQCLEQLEARNVILNEQHMPILSRALRIGSQLQVLKLENCGLTGRPIVILTSSLKLNSVLKELYMADNCLNPSDAIQIGSLLRSNETLQLLDISHNNIQDTGLGHIADGIAEQTSGSGLIILVMWNNHLTSNGSRHIARLLSRSKTLETLNVGHNALSSECLHVIKDALQQNRTLLRLGMQSTLLSCEGIIALAECIADNNVIQRIDLRDNNIQLAGLLALAHSLRVNHSVTQVDLDDRPKKKLEEDEKQYEELVAEIRNFCARNCDQASENKDTVGAEVPERRLCISKSASRKISLTCETLMRNIESSHHQLSQPHHLLPEARARGVGGGGGRLRSPAPSPSPSPVSSPIPSPARNRFQVSRVSEKPSPNSFEVSSPPSPYSTTVAATSSRFQVTSVEPLKPKAESNSVLERNITPGFSFKLNDNDISPTSHIETSNDPAKSDLDFNGSKNNSVETNDFVSSEMESCNRNYSDQDKQTDVNDRSKIPPSIENQMQSLTECASLLSLASDTSEDNDDMEVRRLMDPESFAEIRNQHLTDNNTGNRSQSTSFEFSAANKELDRATGILNPTSEICANNSLIVNRFAVTTVPQPQRKVSWIAPVTYDSEQKVTSNLEKLLGLFQQPGSFFNKGQTQYKATAAIINQQPTSNSDAAFLLTAGPLANAVKDAMLQKSAKLIPEQCNLDSSQSPVPDFINNNKTEELKVSECDDKREVTPILFEKSTQVKTRHHEDENFNLAKPCLPLVKDDDCDTSAWCPVTSVCGSSIKLWDSQDVEYSQSPCSFHCSNLSVIDGTRAVINETGPPISAIDTTSNNECGSPCSFKDADTVSESPEHPEATNPDLSRLQINTRDEEDLSVIPN